MKWSNGDKIFTELKPTDKLVELSKRPSTAVLESMNDVCKKAAKLLQLSLVVLCLCSCSQLQVGNTLYATSIASLVVDYGQTRAIVRSPEKWEEINPVLGKHPTYAQVDVYFPVIITGTILSYPLVKPSMRPYLYGAMTLLETVVITRNLHNGLTMDFVGIKF